MSAGAPHGAPRPSAPALTRVRDGALDWLSAHRAHFRLPDDVTAPHVPHGTTLKPLGELAQLAAGVLRETASGSPAHVTARGLADYAWEQTREGELLHALALLEPYATHPAEIYATFAEAGYRHAGVERYVAFAAGTRYWRGTELLPTRTLAVLAAERRLGLTPHADIPDAAARTWLGGLPEPWAFEARAGYALTHYVFHLTDWGRQPSGLPAAVCDYLTAWLPAWLAACLEEEHWDLAGELLAVCASLPEPLPADTEWQTYAAAQGPDGGYAERGPAPRGQITRETFLGCYHATVVAGSAAALALARPAPGAPSTPAPATAPVPAGGRR
ncbi:hypothetical protein V1J52_15815 [Streptomyces sp. TRM 70351]|uniref:DUF6895 family protein n=1 Tax=Streptomyces sp. TRM 70351 TaxID=3116552 RepID=UPI002E7B7AB1|nr:hypothetical protein [Streptomyces sp. TRM 70351]MEE1929633.1 hypothetical protein [Streptomyces sp. TRM 70351]